MIQIEAMRQAEIEARRATIRSREALRPLARESARRAAQAADDDFMTARLQFWRVILNNQSAA